MTTLWNYLRATPLGELATGSAHVAHPTDITTPLGVRFAGQTILAVHTALEKAATVRVNFDAMGRARLSGIKNIKQRMSPEFGQVLRAEAAATRAQWAVIVAATGWQATLGQRAARPEVAEPANAFSRHRLMFETPEVVVPRAQVDRVYTAVDHPLLDKSVVFSLKRREVEELCHDLKKCGLGVASVKIAVAAQLECWLAEQGEAGLARDLLVTDGLSALLLNTEQGDFIAPRGAVDSEQPRQSVQRPSAIEEDITRFMNANSGRSLTFVGPEELCVNIKKALPQAEIVRPPDVRAHETQHVALLPNVQHDLAFEAKDVRPALPRKWRRLVIGYAVVSVLLAAVGVVNAFHAARMSYGSYQLEREAVARAAEHDDEVALTASIAADFAEAAALRAWASASYHAQRLAYRLLREIPATAGLDKLVFELKDGQVALSFVILGDQEAQLATHRAVEHALTESRCKIGSEEMPTATAGGGRSVQYRMHIILPDAAEAVP